MKTAQEKIDWLKENGVPWETKLRQENSPDEYIFVAVSPSNKVVIQGLDKGTMRFAWGDLWQIVTPPKKTRKLYLWDSKTNSGNIERSSYYYDDDCCALDERLHNVLKNRQWKRKVESSMIEVDEDGNICGGKE